jgi:phosphohistidine phosphatase
MDLFIVRHAIAEPREPGTSDEARALTARGARRFARAVRGLRRLGVRLDAIHHSPWRRALQTAEMLVPLLEATGETIVDPALASPPGPDLLSSLHGARVALVGHEPWLAELITLLLFDRRSRAADDQAPFVLKKGGVAWLEGDAQPGAMKLRALLPPGVLRRVRK